MNWTDAPQLFDLKIDLVRFDAELYTLTNRLGILPEAFLIDHIAMLYHQTMTAQRWYQGFSQCGRVLNETKINGRNIVLFELTTPRVLKGQAIHCIELPRPGEWRYPHEGWEHIEMVLLGETDSFFTRGRGRCSRKGLGLARFVHQTKPAACSGGDASQSYACHQRWTRHREIPPSSTKPYRYRRAPLTLLGQRPAMGVGSVDSLRHLLQGGVQHPPGCSRN